MQKSNEKLHIVKHKSEAHTRRLSEQAFITQIQKERRSEGRGKAVPDDAKRLFHFPTVFSLFLRPHLVVLPSRLPFLRVEIDLEISPENFHLSRKTLNLKDSFHS